MESVLELRSLAESFGVIGVGAMWQVVAMLVMVAAGIQWLWRSKIKVSNDPRIPGLKVRFYNMLGNLDSMVSSMSLGKALHEPYVYILQTFCAHATLFQKQKLFCFWVSFQPMVILVKAEAVEELLRSTIIIDKAWAYNLVHPWLGMGLLTSTGTKWKSRRKMLTPSFHFDILKDFMVTFDEQSRILVDILKKEMVKRDWVDIVHLISLCSLDIVCESTLGVHIGAQRNSQSEYVQAVLRASRVVMVRFCNPTLWLDFTFNFSSVGRQFNKDLKILHSFTRKVIKEKKAAAMNKRDEENTEVTGSGRKRQALMDLLLQQHIKYQTLTEEDIREEVDTFTFEGHDTTAMGISWALYLIGLHSDVQNKIHEELDSIFGDDKDCSVTYEDLGKMKYLELVLKESQRLYPSVPTFGRQIQKDTNICGYTLRKGTSCIVLSYILHRDPDVFPDPEKFDPDRFLPENSIGRHPYAYIPFSAGPRNCIGQRFAVMEEKTVIAHILRHFRVESVEQRDKIHPLAELILRSAYPLKIRFIER